MEEAFGLVVAGMNYILVVALCSFAVAPARCWELRARSRCSILALPYCLLSVIVR